MKVCRKKRIKRKKYVRETWIEVSHCCIKQEKPSLSSGVTLGNKTKKAGAAEVVSFPDAVHKHKRKGVR